jgi:radical SAM superfamily enzyme YgiQ (UPF0313 family)
MSVLLIKPDFPDIAVMPPLGLGYLSAILEKPNIPVKILDNSLLRLNNNQILTFLKEIEPKIVGIYSSTPMIYRALEVAKLSKLSNKEIYTVLGGPHPSVVIEETLNDKNVDAIVIGEGEQSFLELVQNIIEKNFDLQNVSGIAYKNRDKIIQITETRKPINNLDDIPFPAFHLFPMERYFKIGKKFGTTQKTKRNIPIMASRGCPSRCTFCQRFLGRKFRIRSAQNIVDEIEYLAKKYNVTEFNFLDDNFTVDKKKVIEVCDMIHKRNLKINFRFPNCVREDYLDADILKALKSVGCYHLDFGLESGCQKVLNLMKKDKKKEDMARKVYLAKDFNFRVSATFIFGIPGETLSDMGETIAFAKSLPLDSASFGIVIPYPGTELRETAIKNNQLIHSEYDKYNPTASRVYPVLETDDWNGSDLIKIQKSAYRQFYLRPRYAFKALRNVARIQNIGKLRELLKVFS